jgi:HAD superfamily hydrolase (TIGR01459 family)
VTKVVGSLAEIAGGYDALFCDLWGCVHDGLRPFPAAVAALQAFRAGGGAVVLLTNAPRPRAHVERQLDALGVPRDAWDVVATSGDAARLAAFRGVVGQKVWFMGEERDLSFFEPMKIATDALALERVPLDQAEGIVCCGPFDPKADPSVLRPELLLAKTRGLRLLCANPDIVVDRGDSREWCAGAVAQLYTQMGGESLYFGKPHPPVYDLARRRLAALGRDADEARILAVGDGIATDVQGAVGEGLDCLFISGGLAAAETGTGPAPDGQPDPARLQAFLDAAQLAPSHAIGFLR